MRVVEDRSTKITKEEEQEEEEEEDDGTNRTNRLSEALSKLCPCVLGHPTPSVPTAYRRRHVPSVGSEQSKLVSPVGDAQ